MISRTLEYALRAIVWLAYRPEKPHTTREIAEATQIPSSYLSKVLQTLVDGGLILSQRGLGGGFVLAKNPQKLTILDVVNAVEPIPRIRSCPLRLSAHATHLCALHQRLDDALAVIERSFADSTIAELLDDRDSERPLCPAPRETPWQARLGNLAARRTAANPAGHSEKPKRTRGRRPAD